jgi:hypothetical protein
MQEKRKETACSAKEALVLEKRKERTTQQARGLLSALSSLLPVWLSLSPLLLCSHFLCNSTAPRKTHRTA